MNKLPSHNHLYAFIIKNYDKYGLELTSEKEMLALLNELEAYGATLSHLQGDLKSSFCNLFFDSLQNNAQAVSYTHLSTMESVINFLLWHLFIMRRYP